MGKLDPAGHVPPPRRHLADALDVRELMSAVENKAVEVGLRGLIRHVRTVQVRERKERLIRGGLLAAPVHQTLDSHTFDRHALFTLRRQIVAPPHFHVVCEPLVETAFH